MIEKLRLTVVMPVFFVATGALITAPKTAGRCAGEDAVAWVQDNHEALPTTLAELRPFSRPYRMTILRHLDPDARARVWREHLQEVGARPGVTKAQRAYLRAVGD